MSRFGNTQAARSTGAVPVARMPIVNREQLVLLALATVDWD